jgi:hypothetical protein
MIDFFDDTDAIFPFSDFSCGTHNEVRRTATPTI